MSIVSDKISKLKALVDEYAEAKYYESCIYDVVKIDMGYLIVSIKDGSIVSCRSIEKVYSWFDKRSISYSSVYNLPPQPLPPIKSALLRYLRLDNDFNKYQDILLEMVTDLDLEAYFLDKVYLDISYVIINDNIINLDEIYHLCVTYND